MESQSTVSDVATATLVENTVEVMAEDAPVTTAPSVEAVVDTEEAPAVIKKCASTSPNGLYTCRLDDHSADVSHEYLWSTLDGLRVENW